MREKQRIKGKKQTIQNKTISNWHKTLYIQNSPTVIEQQSPNPFSNEIRINAQTANQYRGNHHQKLHIQGIHSLFGCVPFKSNDHMHIRTCNKQVVCRYRYLLNVSLFFLYISRPIMVNIFIKDLTLYKTSTQRKRKADMMMILWKWEREIIYAPLNPHTTNQEKQRKIRQLNKARHWKREPLPHFKRSHQKRVSDTRSPYPLIFFSS